MGTSDKHRLVQAGAWKVAQLGPSWGPPGNVVCDYASYTHTYLYTYITYLSFHLGVASFEIVAVKGNSNPPFRGDLRFQRLRILNLKRLKDGGIDGLPSLEVVRRAFNVQEEFCYDIYKKKVSYEKDKF